jgi:phytoene desaturase
MSFDLFGSEGGDRGNVDGTSVTVVGAGVGGLAAAAYLADAGADVRVLEQHDRAGGHANRFVEDGYAFDTGPSWYLMPDVFERFFGHFGRSPEEFYDLVHLDPHYRVFWKDGDRADVRPDMAHNRALFESYEDGAGEALEAYLDEAEYTYEVGMDRFVYEDRGRLRDFIDLDVLKSAPGLSLLGTMDDHVADYVDHPKLRQLLQYTLVFLGGSPYNTPALYNLLSHVDFNLGVYYPKGGMYSVVEGMVELAEDRGATVETGRPVRRIEPAGGDGLQVQTGAGLADGTGGGERAGERGKWLQVGTDGGAVTADAVLSNANPAHVERELLPEGRREHGEGYWEGRTLAPSAYMLYLGVEGDVDPLAHHTLVLPTDWKRHFESIFEEPRWPEDPAYYVNVPSLTDGAVAPEDGHTVVVLVPIAPGLADDGPAREEFREQVLGDIAAHTGVDLRGRIAVEREACVSEFAAQYGDPRGSALGLAHTLRQTGPFRPDHRSDALEGLYYTGAYTRPGIGVPMCLISGEHAAEALIADR